MATSFPHEAPEVDPSRFARLSDIQRSMQPHANNPFAASSIYSQNMNTNVSMFNGPSVSRRSTRFLFGQLPSRQRATNDSSQNLLANRNQPVPLTYSPAPLPTGWDDDLEDQHNLTALPQAAVISDTEPEPVNVTHSEIDSANTNVSLSEFSSAAPNARQQTRSHGSPPRSDRSRRHRSRRHAPASTTRRQGSTSSSSSSSSRTQRRRRMNDGERVWMVRPHQTGTPSVAARNKSFMNRNSKIDRSKLSVFIMCLFVLVTLITYIVIAVTIKGLGIELHVVFGLILGFSVIFLAFLSIRYHRIRRARQQRDLRRAERRRRRAERAAYEPRVPIRVYMSHDDELLQDLEKGPADEDAENYDDVESPVSPDDSVAEEKLERVKVPPPAYGLNRESVKVNPNLFFWAKVEGVDGNAGQVQKNDGTGKRPPSYLSDDGVSYVVGAQPRSTVSVIATDRVHPAFHALAI